MPTIKSLRAFVLTMEQGSLTLASQTMNLSQPAASRLLQQLEDEFGAPLFYRDSKTLTPSREAAGWLRFIVCEARVNDPCSIVKTKARKDLMVGMHFSHV